MKHYYERYWKIRKDGIMDDFYWKWPKIKHFIPNEVSNILDFGCGSGEIIKQSLKISKKSKFTGIDISKDVLARARRRLPKNTNLIQVGDGERFPIKSRLFNFITALDVIEHVYDVENTITEFNRTLKINGKILISTPFNGAIKILLFTALGYFDRYFNPVGPHIRFFNPKTLCSLLKRHSFKINKIGYYGRFYPLSRGFYILATKMN